MKNIKQILFLLVFSTCIQAQVIDLSPQQSGGTQLINLNGTSGSEEPSAYTARYDSIYNLYTTKPDDTFAEAQNTFIKTLIDSNIFYEKMNGDLFLMGAGHTNTNDESLINWAQLNDTVTAVNDPTFTAEKGWSGGTNQYINTGYNTTTDAKNYKLDSGTVIIHSWTDAATYGYDFGNSIGSSGTRARLRVPATFFGEWSMNFTSGFTTAVDSSVGFFSGIRTDINTMTIYWEEDLIYNATKRAITLQNSNIYLLCQNDDGSPANYSPRQIGLFIICGKLTVAEKEIVRNAWYQYLSDISNPIAFGPTWDDSKTWNDNLTWNE